jgi:hypothetical protein
LRREKVTRRIFIMKRKFMRREEKNSLWRKGRRVRRTRS